jgi:hypothetical protein
MAFGARSAEVSAQEACRSGLEPGQRPGPYSAVISTGPQRGQSYCYVCETADRPAVVVFARTLSDPLGKLLSKLDKAKSDAKQADLRVWATFLRDDQPAFDAKVVAWERQLGLRSIPIGVFEDVTGPPSYRLAAEADVTVLLYVRRQVSANFAFRAGELSDKQIEEVLKTLPRLTGSK